MDRITKKAMQDFANDYKYSHLPESKRFEYFIAYLILNQYYNDSLIDISEIVVGDSGDLGIDAIIVIVNGNIIIDPHDFDNIISSSNNNLDVLFIFIQSEISSSFDTKKLGNFVDGIQDFFDESSITPINDKLRDFKNISKKIYDNSRRFNENPKSIIVYATTGTWQNDRHLIAKKDRFVSQIKGLNIFSIVDIQFIDANAIQRIDQKNKNAISREFSFPDRITLPEIPDVSEAYLGFIKGDEFLKIIHDDNNNIIKNIFYDNVRDWQDFNDVNKEIKETIENINKKARFAIMNNGITIIAKKMRVTGQKVYIEDYQIVNGCQTSHVIHYQKDFIDDKILIPLRLISTEDDEVVASIIKATNRQTQVDEEQLIALSDFQKKLEKYFMSFDGNKLYYERRSKQYNNINGIEKTRIITLSSLIRSFASIFLEEPHITTRNYKGLLEKVGRTIFYAEHKMEPYYLSALLLYKLEYLFRNGHIESRFKVARYHMLLAYRILSETSRIPKLSQFNSHEMARYCEAILIEIHNDIAFIETIKKITAYIDTITSGTIDRDQIMTVPFTEQIKKIN